MARKNHKKKKVQNEPEPAPPMPVAEQSPDPPPAYTRRKGDDNKDDREKQWKDNLEALKVAMAGYDRSQKTAGDEKVIDASAANVVRVMRILADTHTDADVKKHWSDKADKFEKAGKKERGIMSNDIVKGLAVLLATPFVLAGTVIFAAGAILYGAGSFVKGLGDLITFGMFGQTSGEADKKNKD